MSRFRKAIAVTGLFAVLAISATNYTTPVAAAALSISTPIPVADLIECELYCEDEPFYCESGEHDATISDPELYEWNALIQGGSHNGQVCWSGDCVTMHSEGSCSPPTNEPSLSADDLEDLRVALAKGDQAAVRRFVEAFPSQVRPNVDRAAVQVVTCSGVAAHLPAPRSLVADLVTVADSF